MAAAEARAVWQRTANRCFVQEDAKRAPKLACCQSSAASTKQVDSGLSGAVDVPDHSSAGFMPLNQNPSFSNLPPDTTRWWLQLQPGYGYQKSFTYEQLNSLEAKMEILRTDFGNSLPKHAKDLHQENESENTNHDDKNIGEFPFDVHDGDSAFCTKHNSRVGEKETDALKCKNMQKFVDFTESTEIYESMGMNPVGCPVSKESNDLCFDPESPWIASEKTAPWWRTTDKDELASLVAQKSLDYIGNCDLPPPQKMHVRKYPSGNSRCFDCDETSSLDQKSQAGHIPDRVIHAQGTPDSVRTLGRQRSLVEDVRTQYGSDGSSSYSTNQKDTTVTQVSEYDLSKAQLLEALRHSQTRAREAEKAAKQAQAEKEHVVKLFFKQASQLLAYKQWFHLLQLEALYLQIKNNDQPISNLFPALLPWMPCKGRKMRKSWLKDRKSKQGNRGQPIPDVTKYTVAFALGLSLVGAGLLLGWTVGWMLPF